jgi:hypothetical protein
MAIWRRGCAEGTWMSSDSLIREAALASDVGLRLWHALERSSATSCFGALTS